MQALKNKLNGIYEQVELKQQIEEWARHVMMEKRKISWHFNANQK